MKIRIWIPVLCIVSGVGCSGGGSNAPTTGAAASAAAHRTEDCPSIVGDFIQRGGVIKKTLKTTPRPDGTELSDTGLNWTINGHEQKPQEAGAPDLIYVGACEKGTIVLDLMQGAKSLGRMT